MEADSLQGEFKQIVSINTSPCFRPALLHGVSDFRIRPASFLGVEKCGKDWGLITLGVLRGLPLARRELGTRTIQPHVLKFKPAQTRPSVRAGWRHAHVRRHVRPATQTPARSMRPRIGDACAGLIVCALALTWPYALLPTMPAPGFNSPALAFHPPTEFLY